MEKDIFEEDSKFGEHEKEARHKPDISFGKGFGHILEGFGHLFRGLGHIFLKKFNMNLLVLLLLFVSVFSGTWYFLEQSSPEPITTNATCPDPEPCQELNCSTCPVETEYINVTQNLIYYRCKDGRLVTDEDECKANYPEIRSGDVVTADDITFSIDRLDHSLESNNSARLLKINYTILNKRETRIMPRIAIKMYDTWTSEIADEEPRFFISHGELIDGEDWARISKSINIYVGDRDNKIRFGLQNTLPDPDEDIAAIVKKLE